MPEADGVPDIVMTSPDHEALTPVGNPFAPSTPSLLIPVAPVVACVIFVKTVFTHKVGVLDAAPDVFSLTVIVPVAFTLPHPADNGIV